MSVEIHFIGFKILSQIFKPVKENRVFSKRTVKSIFKQGLQSAFFIPGYLFCFIIHLRLLKSGREGKKWLSNLSLEQS